MSYEFQQYYIRTEMVAALERYVSEGFPVGDFLQAVIANDLKEAVGRADAQNMGALPAYAAYMVNEMPAASQGSRKIYEHWLEMHAIRRAASKSSTGETT